MCIILNHEKTTLPIQDILRVNFYIWGDSFSLGQVCVGKILNLHFRGKFYVLRGNFQFGDIFVLLGLFQFGQIGVWEILNIYFEGNFFYFLVFLKYINRLFLIKGLGAKLQHFGVITLKLDLNLYKIWEK